MCCVWGIVCLSHLITEVLPMITSLVTLHRGWCVCVCVCVCVRVRLWVCAHTYLVLVMSVCMCMNLPYVCVYVCVHSCLSVRIRGVVKPAPQVPGFK